MREAIVKIPLKGKGLPAEKRDVSKIGVSRLVNMKPEGDGLVPAYMESDLLESIFTNPTQLKSHHEIKVFFGNELSTSGKTNNMYILRPNADGYYELTKNSFVLNRSTMTVSTGSVTSIKTFSTDNNYPAVVESEGVVLISNGVSNVIIHKTDAYADVVDSAALPKFKVGCYFNGQFIVGNIQQGSTIGNGQATIMWSDIGNYDFTAGMENILNTCTDQAGLTYSDTQITSTDNTIGYAILPANCAIVGLHTLGDGILICTSGGLFKMSPIENMWGIQRLSYNACVASCLGDNQVIFIDRKESSLFRVGADWQVSELGYKYLFSSMTSPLYQMTYFPLRKEFQIHQYKFASVDAANVNAVPSAEYNFLLGTDGLYQTTYKILCDEIIPPYIQSAGTVSINSDNVNFSDRIRIVRTTNSMQDGIVGIGSTTLGLLDSFNVRHVKLISKVNTNKTVGTSLGITLQVKRNTSFDGTPSQEMLLNTPTKELPLKSFITYPNVSGKELYLNLVFERDSSGTNGDITIEELEISLIIEGSIHRRSSNAGTSNT